LHQYPEIIIDRGKKEEIKGLKKSLSGFCGVYRWINKETYETYVGGSNN
jgi:hypothetical protein